MMKAQNVYQENGFKSRNDYLNSLADEYDVEPEKCLSEVDGYLEEMVRLGLVMRIVE